MILLGIKLLLAHLTGDFVLQPETWVRDKEKKKERSKYMYWHVAVHALLLLSVLQFQMNYLWGILFILITHYGIDLAKIYLQNESNKILLFFTDQILHLLVLLAVVFFCEPFVFDFSILKSTQVLTVLTALIMLTQVASIVIRNLLSKWKVKEMNSSQNNAGKFIGIAERLFILGFVMMNYWEGIGFLLAAKSVFRFGDLNNAKDRDLTEYILLGTLLSFGIGILIAVSLKYVWTYLP